MFCFNDDKSKAPIVVIEFEDYISANNESGFSKNISAYIDSVGNYALLSAGYYIPGASSQPYANEWYYSYLSDTVLVPGSQAEKTFDPSVSMTDGDNNAPTVNYTVKNMTNSAKTITTRIVLLKVA